MSEQNELCPVCGMGHVHRRIEIETFEYKGAQLQAEDYFEVCDVCGTEQASDSQMRDSARSMQRARKRHDGLLMGEEIKAIRNALKLTQGKAQELFGGGPVSFSKYENDEVIHSKLLDVTLRMASKDEAYLEAYAREAGVALPYRKYAKFAKGAERVYEARAVQVVMGWEPVNILSAMDRVADLQPAMHDFVERGRAPHSLLVAQYAAHRG